jgi:glycosyltransferase involved in cell wall biosynthesis
MKTQPLSDLSIGMAGLWPYPIGGVATTCYHLSKELSSHGHQIFFFDNSPHSSKLDTLGLAGYTTKSTKWVQQALMVLLTAIGLRRKRFRPLLINSIKEMIEISYFWHRPHRLLKCLIYIVEMAEYWDKKNIDLLHGHHAGFLSWATLMVAKHFLKCPLVLTVYTSEFTMSVNQPFLPVAIRLCNNADVVMCISNYTRTRATQAGCENPNMFVVHLACDQAHYTIQEPGLLNRVQTELDIAADIPMILYVGHLVERKGPHIVVQALQEIVDLDWQAIFIGPDYGMFNRLQMQAKTLGIEQRVSILGQMKLTDLLAVYDLAHIFVFPTVSEDEGFGIVGLEAMAHELPVLGSRTGAISEILVDGITGFLFTPGNALELAGLLRRLITERSLRERMSASAKERAQDFSWSITTANLERLYEQAIKGRI